MNPSRRQFVAGGMVALAATALLAACGGDDDDADPGPGSGDCGSTGTAVSIGANHGHTLAVPAADVAAGAEKTYNIQGSSAHPHTVTLTAANFATLQGGQYVQVESSSDSGHTHMVDVSCP